MSVNLAISTFAGFMIMASLAFTGFCPAAKILKALGLPESDSCGTSASSKCC
jgi:hypothetical protein